MLIIKNNSIIIKFNKNFYRKKSVEETIKAYKKLCTATIKNQKNYFLIELYPKQKEINLKTISLEFSNYVLSLER